MAGIPQQRKKSGSDPREDAQAAPDPAGEQDAENQNPDTALFEAVRNLKKGMKLPVRSLDIKEGETSPPKRYNSGSMILAMENAGQLIEDEELRAQIKGSGIGTSATRAEILKKLIHIKYLALNKKTQIITPTLQGEMVYDVVDHSIRPLLNPELTASWEKGLTYVAEGSITPDEYMVKLDHFITSRTVGVKGLNNQYQMRACYDRAAEYYKKGSGKTFLCRQSKKKKNKIAGKRRKRRRKMEALTVKELYTLDETIAKDIFDGGDLSVGSPSEDQQLYPEAG